jgi:hypothetical protein
VSVLNEGIEFQVNRFGRSAVEIILKRFFSLSTDPCPR